MSTNISATSKNNYVAWEVLDLISHHLDPKTLAVASCVSKSWCSCFSTDHLWGPLCCTHFPSLTSTLGAATVPRRRLYAIGHAASSLRQRQPSKPRLSLDDLMFSVLVCFPSSSCNKKSINIMVLCRELARDEHGLFRFDVEVEEDGRHWSVEELEGARVTWNVVEKDWRAVFTMAEDSSGKGSFVSGVDGWFSEELPSPGCCSSTVASGLVADLKLGMRGVGEGAECGVWGGGINRASNRNNSNSKVKIEKVSLGVMCVLNWRYITIEDGLSYLDHFIKV